MNIRILCAVLCCASALLLTSCYTQFEVLPADAILSPADSARLAAAPQAASSREYCVWERDFFGRWELHCYDENRVPPSWSSYADRPWWYSDFNDADMRCHCPRHIVYNARCELCWEYCNRSNRFGFFNDGYHRRYNDHDYIGPAIPPGGDTATQVPQILPPRRQVGGSFSGATIPSTTSGTAVYIPVAGSTAALKAAEEAAAVNKPAETAPVIVQPADTQAPSAAPAKKPPRRSVGGF